VSFREKERLDETDLLLPRPHDNLRIEQSIVSFDVDTGESSYSGSPEEKEREGKEAREVSSGEAKGAQHTRPSL